MEMTYAEYKHEKQAIYRKVQDRLDTMRLNFGIWETLYAQYNFLTIKNLIDMLNWNREKWIEYFTDLI